MHLPSIRFNSIHIRFGITILLNTMFTAIQIIYAHKTCSVSLLSDALHNVGDALGLFIAWGAQTLAYSTKYPPRYTYGYQKAPILGALFNALLLLFSVGIIVRETIFQLTHAHPMNEAQVLLIATLGIFINGFTTLLFVKEKDTNLNIRATFLHLAMDTLTSLGVLISALGVYYIKYQWIDSMMALFIASITFLNGWKLLLSALDSLLGAVPPHIDLHSVTQHLKTLPGVVDIKNLHIWSLGTSKTALTAHLIMKDIESNFDNSFIEEELVKKFGITQITLQPIRLTFPVTKIIDSTITSSS